MRRINRLKRSSGFDYRETEIPETRKKERKEDRNLKITKSRNNFSQLHLYFHSLLFELKEFHVRRKKKKERSPIRGGFKERRKIGERRRAPPGMPVTMHVAKLVVGPRFETGRARIGPTVTTAARY